MNNSTHTCDTCRYWYRDMTSETPGYHPCSKESNDGDLDGFTGGDGGEPCNAGGFASGPKFGCVHWERANLP